MLMHLTYDMAFENVFFSLKQFLIRLSEKIYLNVPFDNKAGTVFIY